jgi:hypothetical protein
MTKPKNLNTEYGRRYLNWVNGKKQAQEEYEKKLASLLPFWSGEEYEQFKKFYFTS